MIRNRYAVFGNPIAHSRSPLIHNKFASDTGQVIEYGARLIDVEKFSDSVDEFFLNGGHGLNITVPFKLEASSSHCPFDSSGGSARSWFSTHLFGFAH